MFRKFWKTFKFFILLIVVLICMPHSLLPRQTIGSEQKDLDKYVTLNNAEMRLSAFKDDTEILKIKLAQIDIINTSRKKYKAPPVKLDILASRVANKMCREAAENNFVGHWNLAGEKPYHRYAFAGGYDHVSENAYGEWSSDNYINSPATIVSKMIAGHNKFMAEKSPHDGHKKNIIEKSHNYVGIGIYLSGNQFRYYEEFIDRYFEFENIPSEVKVGETFSITVRTNNESFLYYLIAYKERFPQPLTPAQLKKKTSYEDYSNDKHLTMPAWDLAMYRSGISYKIPLLFSEEGLYYIHLYSDKKEITKASSLSTKGKYPVSGIVIKVNK